MSKVKLILAVIAVSAIFLVGIYTRMEELLFADKLDQMEWQIKNQVSSLTLAYQADAKFLQKWVHIINDEGTRKINWNSMSPYFAVAQLNARLQVIEWSFREKSPVSSLSKENLTQLINSFHVKIGDKELKYIIYNDPEKKKIFLTLVPQKDKLWVFLSLGENLQSIMDVQKTSPYMITLINSDFLSLAHVKSEYVGQKIFENKLISEIKTGSKASTSGSFKISSGEEFFGFYEKIPDLDLYVYTQASLSELLSNRNSIKSQFVFFSVGFLIIIISLILLLNRGRQNPNLIARAPVTSMAKPSVSGVSVNAKPEDLDQSRVENYMNMASVIGHEIKAPIVKILNLTATALSQSENLNEKDSLNKIQSEVRSAKEIVDKLLMFSGEQSDNKIESKVDIPLMKALKSLDKLFSEKSIKIEKNFQFASPILVDVNRMTVAFENIFKNSVQAMERMSVKIISIKTYQKEKSIFIEITDNGEGIEKEDIKKIFDPFFTTKDSHKNSGLGLSTTLAIIKNHQGSVVVESVKGAGTTVKIEFPQLTQQQSKESVNHSKIALVKSENKEVPPKEPLLVEVKELKAIVLPKEPLLLDIEPIKPLDLNVNVDEMFEMQEEPNPLIEEPPPSSEPVLVSQFIVPPQVSPKKSLEKESDSFKVQIRKPKGGNS